MLVSILTIDEVAERGLLEEERLCNHYGNRFFGVPIGDRSVPDEMRIRESLDAPVKQLERERAVGFHCRGGIGRSSMLAALVLAGLGWKLEDAFRAISAARGCTVPDTPEQELWVRKFVRGSRHRERL